MIFIRMIDLLRGRNLVTENYHCFCFSFKGLNVRKYHECEGEEELLHIPGTVFEGPEPEMQMREPEMKE